MIKDKIKELLTKEERKELEELEEQQKQYLKEMMEPILEKIHKLAIKKHTAIQPTRSDPFFNDLYESMDRYSETIGKRMAELRNLGEQRYIDSFAPGIDGDSNAENYERLKKDCLETLGALTKTDFIIYNKRVIESKLKYPKQFADHQAFILTNFATNTIWYQIRVCDTYKSKRDKDLIKLAIDMITKLLKKPIAVKTTNKIINSAKAIAEKENLEQFSKILQNTGLNQLTKIDTKKQKVEYDPVSKLGKVTKGDFTLTMANFKDIEGFTATTHQLLDALFLQYTETKTDDRGFVNLPLKKYMQLRDVENEKVAREQVNRELETLYSASISFTDKKVKQTHTDKNGNTKTTRKPRNYLDVRIIQEKGLRNSIISVMFSDRFNKEVLPNLHFMDYPKQLLRINSHNNPNSFYFGRKIAELKRMNAGKPNEDLISVKTLLENCPTIPTYEDVMKSNKHIGERIIEPFERDMENLSSILGWHYCHSNGALLTNEELATLDYDLFITLLVKIEWRNYPDQTKRIEQKTKQKRAEAARINKAMAKEKAKQIVKDKK